VGRNHIRLIIYQKNGNAMMINVISMRVNEGLTSPIIAIEHQSGLCRHFVWLDSKAEFFAINTQRPMKLHDTYVRDAKQLLVLRT
jgi:hypothetical protein